MKKENKFDVMSEIECKTPGCKNRIKQNVVDRKDNNNLFCFSCYREQQSKKGNEITTAREVRTGVGIGRKKGIYGI